jgi:putative DNA methylase
VIQKCVLEYPQRYGHDGTLDSKTLLPHETNSKNSLFQDVSRWGQYVLEEVKKEIGKFYPDERDGSSPVAYLWARTIPCQNPSCGATIPLLKQFWLANRDNKKIALYPFKSGKQIRFKIVGTDHEDFPKGFDPEKGTVSRAIATCVVCGSVTDDKTTRNLFISSKAGHEMIAVVSHHESNVGKNYRLVEENDLKVYHTAEVALAKKRELLLGKYGLDPVPDEPTPKGKGRGAERAFSVRNYNMSIGGDLFNSRQKLVLITLVEKTRSAFTSMLKSGYEEEYAKAVVTYIALLIDKIASSSNVLCRWQPNGEKIADIFARQAIPMVWDYPEVNVLTGASRSFDELFGDILHTIEELSAIPKSAVVTQSSATHVPYSDKFFDAVFTDPPYYDNVPYSYLSDFFYVWLKRSIGHLYPELFSTPLSPKSEEIVAYSNIEGGFEAGKKYFEEMLGRSFKEIFRVLKPDGIAIIVYAHKSTAGWETLINSLLNSGLVITAAWPIHTEMKHRLRGMESAALASSIYMVSRKIKKFPTGFYKQVKEELNKHLTTKLDDLWHQGISGADFFIAAIGSSVIVFGKYDK